MPEQKSELSPGSEKDIRIKNSEHYSDGLSKTSEEYFEELGKEIQRNYEVAGKARKKGLDPVDEVEVPLALTMAAKVVKLIATMYPQLDNKNVINRVLELEKEYGSLDPGVSFKIAEEVAKEKYCKFENQLEAIDAGIRIGFAYTTLGVVSSPIEGYTGIKIGKTQKGETYLKAFFSGPIRSAGTTAGCVSVILIDYLRQLFGYARYDPTEEECKRVVTELYDYHERVTNLQYLPTEEEAYFIAKNLSIQLAGEPTENKEVSNYKDLARVESNFIRGGFCLILGEGLAQKAAKGLRILNSLQKKGFEIKDWEWLEKYTELHEKREKGKTDDSPTYIKDLVAGRPVLGHPGKGFRFRYGRSRVAGFSAVSLHPATMAVTNDFIATGTQLKIEKPTKGCVVTVCDQIDGPIVKFKNGSVKKLENYEEAKKLYQEIDEIIYLGDILFPLGDVINRNAKLVKPGYVEEWWELELNKAGGKVEDCFEVSLEDVVELSKKYGVALHPNYIYYWSQISYEQFLGFVDWFQHARINNGKLLFLYNKSEKERFQIGKRALELLGAAHSVSVENVVLEEKETKTLLVNLGFDSNFGKELNIDFDFKKISKDIDEKNKKGEKVKEGEIVLEIINRLSKFKIKDKAGEFIGARMGRPEKAKLRKLTGSPNVLFPIGEEGGRFRSVNAALEVGVVKGEFPFNYCEKCNLESIYNVCEICGSKIEKRFFCRMCDREIKEKKCKVHDRGERFKRKKIDMKHYFEKAREKLNYLKTDIPDLIKGVRGTSSENHDLENLCKGILRAKYNLCVNKDGTIRYDMTELPLTHFKPKEIEVSVERLKELGYNKDYLKKDLVDENQILELKPQDILLPCNNLSGNEKGDEVFMNISKFMDELLVKVYGLPSFYNVKSREDLVGQLGVCMAPHNCAGVICRIIGFSKVQGLLASPYMHAAIRRDCVYPTTNFVYEDDEGVKSERIGDFVEGLIKKGNSVKQVDSYGTVEIGLKDSLFAFGVDPITKRLKKKKIKHFIKGEAPEGWIRIKTASGREQIMTPRHKFIYLESNKDFKVKKASEIKKGDRLAILRDFIVDKGISKINLLEALSNKVPIEKQGDIRIVGADSFFKKMIDRVGGKKIRQLTQMAGFKSLFDWYKLVPLNHARRLVERGYFKWEDLPSSAKIRTIFNNKKWELDLGIGEGLMRILGYYSAEGYCRQNKTVSQVCFRIMEGGQRKRLIKDIKNTFGISPSLGEEKTKITICNKLIYYLFKYVLDMGGNAYNKKVPDLIYNVSKSNVLEYLSAYFDGDGSMVNSKGRRFFAFYSVSRDLLQGVSLLLTRWKLFGRFSKTNARFPGKKILERYKGLGKDPKQHILNHLVYSGRDFFEMTNLLKPYNLEKKRKLSKIKFREARQRKILFDKKYYELEEAGDVYIDIVKEVTTFNEDMPSYCFEIENNSEEDKNVLWGEQIINARCDGDEAAVMLLLDVLINFSRKFLPSHRGGTQDAPLVLNGKIYAKEVDEQILDFELVSSYPLELYEKAEQGIHSSQVKIEMVKQRIRRGEDSFVNTGFTHNTIDFNSGANCSSYKILPTMQEKVEAQMKLCEKLRSVDQGDVARLIIDRHFMRDLKGNLRKFSQQSFRCSKCNTIYRRPPLNGKCEKEYCTGNIIFTISYGSIVKYLEPAIDLTKNYDVPEYIKQDLELTKKYIESIFGKETEKQESIERWF